jgi:hypothetical protein
MADLTNLVHSVYCMKRAITLTLAGELGATGGWDDLSLTSHCSAMCIGQRD